MASSHIGQGTTSDASNVAGNGIRDGKIVVLSCGSIIILIIRSRYEKPVVVVISLIDLRTEAAQNCLAVKGDAICAR